jgi:hypothetical protein
MNYVESEKNFSRGHIRVVTKSRGASKLLNTLEGILCIEGTKRQNY